MTLHALPVTQLQVGDTVVMQDTRYRVAYIEDEPLGKELFLKSPLDEKAIFVGSDTQVTLEV